MSIGLKVYPPESHKIYRGLVMNAGWFPIDVAYTPMDHIAKLFYNRNHSECGDALGRYSAEVSLTGIYKAFVMIANPQYLMRRGTTMMSTYYKPCNIEIQESGAKRVVLHITSFPIISKVFEYRVAGWCKRALEISGGKNVNYRITKSLMSGAPETEIVFSWS